MKRPSKKEIQEAVQRLKEHKSGQGPTDQPVMKPQDKKPNKNRIRKQGV
jgi:hypothetical protein